MKILFHCLALAGICHLTSNAWGEAAAFTFFDPEKASEIPTSLSKSGLFQDINAKKFTAQAIPFNVNTPLWSDAAEKSRFILVPAMGQITYSDTSDYYGFPAGTVFAKNFLIDTIPGQASSRIWVETRLLVSKKVADMDRWFGFSYKWGKDQKDARLISIDAETHLDTTYRVWPTGLKGQSTQKKWTFPSSLKCDECHRQPNEGVLQGRTVLGFFTAQLNRPSDAKPELNQLKHFFDIGLFKKQQPLPDFAKSPKWARLNDESVTLEIRSRSYIGANCSGCHGGRGMEVGAAFGISMNLDYHAMKPQMDLVNYEPQAEYGLSAPPWPKLAYPGKPENSLLVHRPMQRNLGITGTDSDFDIDLNQMPPLATYEVDTAAVRVLSAWIKSLPQDTMQVNIPTYAAAGREQPSIRSGFLHLPGPWAQHSPRMSDVSGRTVRLRKAGHGTFQIDGDLRKGIYFVSVHGSTFTRYVF